MENTKNMLVSWVKSVFVMIKQVVNILKVVQVCLHTNVWGLMPGRSPGRLKEKHPKFCRKQD